KLNLTFCVVLCVLHLTQISAQRNREYCEEVYRDCQSYTTRIGRFDETIDSYNRYCRRERRGRWTNVSRCEMEKATCICALNHKCYYFLPLYNYPFLFVVILQRCDDMSCKNIAEVLGF
ncbi:hypothetical protein KR018_005606, partial [Drosophila ironensis]